MQPLHHLGLLQILLLIEKSSAHHHLSQLPFWVQEILTSPKSSIQFATAGTSDYHKHNRLKYIKYQPKHYQNALWYQLYVKI